MSAHRGQSTIHGAGETPEQETASSPEPTRPLNERELEVMSMLAHGAGGQEIARALFISPEAVRSRTRSARVKLGAKTRSHAVALAVHSGQIGMRTARTTGFGESA